MVRSTFGLAIAASFMCSTGQVYAQAVARKPTAAFDFVGANPTPLCIFDKSSPPVCVPIGTVDSTTHSFASDATTLNGATFAAPGPIGAGTAGAGTFTTVTANTLIGSANISGASNWIDTTSVAGNVFKYYTDISGTPTDATIAKFNRVFCGTSTATSGGYPASPVLWTSELYPNWEAGAQLSCINSIGNGAAMFASRTSDYRTAAGVASPGSTGINAMALNDDTVAGVPIANAGLFQGVRASGVLGTTLGIQIDTVNWGNVVDVTPYDGAGATGRTVGVLMTPGAIEKPPNVRANSSAAFAFHPHAGVEFRKGMVVNSLALDTTLGAAGNGIFIEMAPEQEFAWRDSGGALIAELWGHTTNGVEIHPKLTVTGDMTTLNSVNAVRIRGTDAAPTVSACGTSPAVAGTSNSIKGLVIMGTGTPTSCTVTFATAYPTTPHCAVSPANAAAAGVSYYSSTSLTAITITLTAGTSGASYNYVCAGDV
jgi:hypothetical protein